MFPNQDGIQFFLSSIWNKVRALRPGATFVIVGKVSQEHKAAFEACAGVTCAGYVEDVRPHLSAASCCVVPLRVGGGTRLKILDAWAMGRPVVSTTIGCEGLSASDAQNIIMRDSPDDFAAAVCELLTRPDLGERLGTNARDTAERYYSWERVCQPLTEKYGLLMDRLPS
jgi:glycosyltransferase involved in cell wall biosynthesis